MEPSTRPNETNIAFVGFLWICAAAACGTDGRSSNAFGNSGNGATGTQGTGAAAAAGTASDGDADGASEASDGVSVGGDPFWDVGPGNDPDDPGGQAGDCGCPEPSPKSHIWVANSGETTVSKINTVTMTEEGRYRVHPGNGSPSRTSVNISGRAVAVANRSGGITKIWANPEDCTDANGDGTLQTSSGAGDLLAWESDECVAWHRPLTYSSNRPVAFTCFGGTEKIWTSGTAGGGGPPGGGGPIDVLLLDGTTGVIEQTIVVDGFGGGNFGAYGGAVDSAGDFWIIPNGVVAGFGGGAKLARIDAETFDYEFTNIPPEITSYGITVDANDDPWVTSFGSVGAARFNVASGTWDTVAGFKSQSGIMQDSAGLMWVGTGTQNGMDPPIGVHAIDPDTMELKPIIPLPGGEIKGISVDRDGHIWAVNQDPGTAHRIDPASGAMESYSGLNAPYTYSDMTGYGIQNTTGCVPPPVG